MRPDAAKACPPPDSRVGSSRASLRPRHPGRDRCWAHCARPLRPGDDPAVEHRRTPRQVLPGLRQPQVPAHRPGRGPVRPHARGRGRQGRGVHPASRRVRARLDVRAGDPARRHRRPARGQVVAGPPRPDDALDGRLHRSRLLGPRDARARQRGDAADQALPRHEDRPGLLLPAHARRRRTRTARRSTARATRASVARRPRARTRTSTAPRSRMLPLDISPAVQAALDAGQPVVALESTIISHGLPRPDNLEAARGFEAILTEHGGRAGDDRGARRPAQGRTDRRGARTHRVRGHPQAQRARPADRARPWRQRCHDGRRDLVHRQPRRHPGLRHRRARRRAPRRIGDVRRVGRPDGALGGADHGRLRWREVDPRHPRDAGAARVAERHRARAMARTSSRASGSPTPASSSTGRCRTPPASPT